MLRRSFAVTILSLGTLSGAAPEFSKTTYVYKNAGGHEIKLDVMRPPDERVRPVILYIHGGALIFGSRGGINAEQLRRYIRAGFAVVSIDYRLAPETKLPEILEDVRDAHRWVRANGRKLLRVDADRLAVVGHSAGGYLTLMTGILLEPRPKALVPYYGYGDIAGEWYSRPDPFYSSQPAVPEEEARAAVGTAPVSDPPQSSPRMRFYLYCRQHGLWPKEVTGRDPDAEPRAFDPWCPVRNVTRQYPPTMLLHGDADTDVPYRQSVMMAEELKRHGVEYELITIPSGPHGFDRAMDKPEISAIFDRAVQFISRRLKP
jgi:acetyl esterase/lipase